MIFIMVLTDEGRGVVCEIYDRHYKAMLYTATQLLGRERGEDAVHDVFAKIIVSFEKNIKDLGDKPARFFVIIVRNHSLNILKRERFDLLPLEEELVNDATCQSQDKDPEGVALNNEAVEILASHIRRLSPAMRQAFEYRYIEGYSNIEIADILGITQSAVSTRIDKARKRLKELLLESEVANGHIY